jgi:hypothetical protein
VPGRDDFTRAGYPNGDANGMPADLAAVQADDALLDMLGRVGDTPSDADDYLTCVLAAWRREVHAEPIRELVDTDTAIAVIRAARQPVRRRDPVFGSIAAAAAVLVIAFSGVGLVAKSAQPGDHLWGVTQVLYGNYARSVETAAAVRTELQEANTALKQGNPERARAALQRVQQQLPAVGDSEGRTDLTARHRQLEQILNGPPDEGRASVPGSPMSPPDSATRTSRESSPLTRPGEPPTSTEPTMPSWTHPQPSITDPPQTVPVSPSRDGSPGSATTGGATAGGATAGGTTSGTTSGAGSVKDPRDIASHPPSQPPSSPPDSDHSSVGPRRYPGGYQPGNGVPPGCDRVDPRPPYCGPDSGG